MPTYHNTQCHHQNMENHKGDSSDQHRWRTNRQQTPCLNITTYDPSQNPLTQVVKKNWDIPVLNRNASTRWLCYTNFKTGLCKLPRPDFPITTKPLTPLTLHISHHQTILNDVEDVKIFILVFIKMYISNILNSEITWRRSMATQITWSSATWFKHSRWK